MPSARLSKKEKESLLTKLKDGFDLKSAGADLGLTEAQIGLAQGKHGAAMDKAFDVGTGKLKVKIMQHALDTVNPAVLLKLLELREKESEKTDPITLVERVIVQMQSCPHCDNLLGNPILEDKEPSTEKVKLPIALGSTDDNLPVDAMAEKVQNEVISSWSVSSITSSSIDHPSFFVFRGSRFVAYWPFGHYATNH